MITTFSVGAKTFHISSDTIHSIEMYFDHTKIHEADFEFIVNKESRCASFYIHLVATPKNDGDSLITMSVSLRLCFESNKPW